MGISFRQRGRFDSTTKFLERCIDSVSLAKLKRYGEEGVEALSSATPVDTGLTADSWYYEINTTRETVTISFHNSNIQNGVPIAIILQYGHATRNGGWVEGRDYINPAIQPVFDRLANESWKEVIKK